MSKQAQQQSKTPSLHPTHHAGKSGVGNVNMPNCNQQTKGDQGGSTVHIKRCGSSGKWKSL